MKVGVIGTGWGLRLIKTLVDMGIEPALVYGHKNREHLTYLNFTEDVDEVFDVCDAVVCAVPPHLNIEMVKKAGTASTGLFVEKPMASSLEEAGVIVEVINQSCITFMVGDCFCYSDNIDELRYMRITHAISRIKRQHPANQINPYWHLAVHHIALFTMLGIDIYAIELLLDKAFTTNGYNQMEFWGDNGQRITFSPTGDYVSNELKHFLYCCESREKPLTDAVHGCKVIKQLTERYGTIGQCLGN